MMAKRVVKDFDAFLAEREDRTMIVHIYGRDCVVPKELPFVYVLKIERMLRGEAKGISADENVALMKQMFKPEDLEYITTHSEFRISDVWNLIAFAWLRGNADAPEKSECPVFRTEDDLKVEQTQESASKK